MAQPMIVWGAEEVARLIQLYESHEYTYKQIAKVLNQEFRGRDHTEDTVRGKLRRLKVQKGGGVATKRKGVDGTTQIVVDGVSVKELTKQLLQERKLRERLEHQLKGKIETHKVPILEYFGPSIRFAACGDVHLGSLYDRHDLLEKMFQICEKEKIKDIFHAGDVFDGIKVYKGQEYELEFHGADAQLNHAVDTWPKDTGIMTHFIGGNHDYSFFRHGGLDICTKFAKERPNDVTFLGQDEGIVGLKTGDTVLNMMLVHPLGGSAYTISYRSQKFIEALPGGRKPHILLLGHFHKADFLPCYRNVLAFQVGCLQSQTPHFMRPKGLAAHLGFWIIELRATKEGVARCKGEFIPFYEL